MTGSSSSPRTTAPGPRTVPAYSGTVRGPRGPASCPPAGWFCPVWFGQQPILGVTEHQDRAIELHELPADRADWPEEWLDEFEERAAIAEHCGGLPRERAEHLAEERVRLMCARSRQVPGGDPP